MFRISRLIQRRWSLLLVVAMLLHWTLGVCAAADVLCIEPDGKVVAEYAGTPCKSEQQELTTAKPCIDLQAGDDHTGHQPVPSSQLQLLDLQSSFLIPALTYLLPAPSEISLALPAATGPPVSTHPVVLRKTTVLLI